jgi:PAS domain S-box-containing protein
MNRTETPEREYLFKAIDAFRRRMIVISPQFEILATNDGFGDRSPLQLVGKKCHQIYHDRSTPCIECAARKVLETGATAFETRGGGPGDSESLPCFYAYPIVEDGRIEAVVSMDFDLPPRSKIEAELQRTNALLRNLILSAVDGVIAADKAGKILIYNDTAAEVFGYSVNEALDHLDIRDIYPDGTEHEVMRRLRSEKFGGRGKLKSFEVDVVHKDGTRIPISLNAAIVYEGEREVATIGFFHDLRQILQMKQELEQTQIQLLQSEKMASLGKLAAGVAHQLNNPVGGITLYTRLVLEEYDLPEGAVDDLKRVLKDAERCRDTIKELLEFTRQTRQLMQLHDLNRAVERTLFLLENQTLFHNIDITRDLSESLPQVRCDSQQMNHMLMNIILNAAQAMEGRGKLLVRTSLSPGGERVRLEISDTGPGIAEDVLPRIFEPFFTTKDEGQGTGLGLSLVYGIVENHGGRISVHNRPGGGARFVIDLPANTGKQKGADGER